MPKGSFWKRKFLYIISLLFIWICIITTICRFRHFSDAVSHFSLHFTHQFRNSTNIEIDTLFTQLAPKDSYVFTQTVATYLYPIYLILCFTPFIQSLIVRLVTEKEKKLRQGMSIMGLSDTSYYISWFLTYGITVFVFSILFTALGSIQYLWVHRLNKQKKSFFLMCFSVIK